MGKKANVRVVLRARPTAARGDNFRFDESTDTVDMHLPRDAEQGPVNNQQESWHFKLDRVMVNASQEQVFTTVATDIIKAVMDGYNGTILAYGQTGAGKTHTMTGGHAGFADRGMVPRCISAIYSESQSRPESSITIRLSYTEIYNELMFDLLTDTSVAEQSGDLAIVEEKDGRGITVRGLSMPVASSEEEALHIFFEGDTNRHVAEHALNKGSTRSHCVFTIYVECRSRVESSEKVIFSKLHLVDLAGSERVKKSGSEGQILKEATYINKSLTFLEQVVHALGNRHRDHVPYRQSKLTYMLKDSLGGNCKTSMIANVWPEASMIEETASTLRFATRMMRVANEAERNVHLDPALLMRKYEREIKELKQELAMHDTLAGRSRQHYGEEYTPEEQQQLEGTLKQYVEGEVLLENIEIPSLTMVHESFKCFRKLYMQLKDELAQRPAGGTGAAARGAENVAPDADAAPSPAPEGREGDVGEDEEGRGISVGVAPPGSKPFGEGDEKAPAGDGTPGDDGDMRTIRASKEGRESVEEGPPDKQALFVEWKKTDGQVLEESFERNRQELKERKTEMKDMMARANAKKKDIDVAKERLARKQAEKGHDPGDAELIDEEEYALIRNLKDLKQDYRDAFDQHKAVKTDVIQIEHMLQQCKQKLVSSFEEWYEGRYGHLIEAAKERQASAVEDGERYDPQEQFDLLEAGRMEAQHPDALAYHKARKTATRNLRQKPPAGAGRPAMVPGGVGR
jgi:kinesin family protein 6/9